jgi:DNA-binding NarL/FixJ family response regulator
VSRPLSRSPIRVLIADDQRVVREGLAMLVGFFDGVEVVGTAGDGTEAMDLAIERRPDVVLMDLRMPLLDGAAATRALLQSVPSARVLVLTTYADDDSIFPALEAGACGYLTKDASADQIEAAIRSVHAGRTYLDPVVQQRLVAAISGDAESAPGASEARAASTLQEPITLPDGLTTREAQVLALIADGLSNAEIADRLVLSHATVKSHINRIFSKTNVRDRAQAVGYAYRMGFGTTKQR